MSRYIGINGVVVKQPHHNNIIPITAVLFTDSTDTQFNPGFTINTNGDAPIPITGEFQYLQEIVGDYQPRKGGGQDGEDIKDIMSKLDWTGYAYLYDDGLFLKTPRLLLVSNPCCIDKDIPWREISTAKLKEMLNSDFVTKGKPELWK